LYISKNKSLNVHAKNNRNNSFNKIEACKPGNEEQDILHFPLEKRVASPLDQGFQVIAATEMIVRGTAD